MSRHGLRLVAPVPKGDSVGAFLFSCALLCIVLMGALAGYMLWRC